MKYLLAATFFALAGCFTQQELIGPPESQAWMRQALNDPNSNEPSKRFSLAYHGDPTALHTYFMTALKHAESPEINVEAGEALSFELPTILYHVGDSRFAAVLAREPTRIQSAVACFLEVSPNHPMTKKLIDTAPEIDFPILKTYRGDGRDTPEED